MNDAPDNEVSNELAALRRRVKELEARAARFAKRGPDELCSATFAAISDPAVLVDLDQRIIAINSALRTMSEQYGVNTDVAGRDFCEAYPFVPDSIREDHQRLLRTGQSYVSEATVNIEGQRITYEAHVSPVVVDGRIARVLHVIRDITAGRETERALADRLDLEALILTISSDFISLQPDEIDHGINAALKAIGEFIAVERSLVFIFSDDGATMSRTHEWCAEGIEPQIDNLQAIPTETYPWLTARLKRNEVLYVSRLCDLPVEASGLIDTLKAQGILSVLAVPMFHGERLVGFLGLDSVQAERTWTQDSIVLLRATANIIGNTLHRKRAEEVLRESEQQYRSLVEDVPVGIYRTSPDGHILAANPALLEMLGFDSLDELNKRNLEANGFAPGHPRGEFKELIEREGLVRDFESTWVRRDGTALNVREAAAVVRDADGTVLYYEGTVEDVTERKQTEETFRLAMEATSDALWDWNIRTNHVYRNPRHATMLGYEPDELTSEQAEWEARIHPDDRETLLAIVGETSEGTCESFQVEYRLRSKTGEYIWVLGRGSVVERAEDGAPSRMIGTNIDITERKQAEEALRTSDELLKGVLDHTHMMAVYLDPQFNFVWVNSAYAATCGHDLDFFPGRNHFDLYPHDENEAIFQRVVDTGEPFFVSAKPFEFPDQLERGTTYWDWSLIPTKDASDNVTGLVFTLAEITKRIRAENALRQSERQLAIRSRIADIFLTIPDEGMYAAVLDVVLNALQSKYGIFGYVDDDGALVCPSMTVDIWDKCRMSDKTVVFPREVWGGIWGRALIEGETRYSNEPFDVPEGHVPVLRALDVPIVYRREVIGNLLVGNKPTDYDEGDTTLLETLAASIAPILHARLAREKEEKERRRAEEVLQLSEQSLATAQRVARIGSWDWRIQEGTVTWSDETCRQYGLEPGQVLPNYEAFERFIHPSDRDLVNSAVREALEEDEPYSLDVRMVRADGTEWTMHTEGIVYKSDDGEPTRFVGTQQDITERKQAERDLREAHAKLVIVREQERRRLASELHDSICQDLVAVQLAILEAAAAGSGRLDAEQNRLLVAAAEQCTGLAREVRGICYGLYPPALHTLGLVPALRQLGRYCNDHVEFSFTCPADFEKLRFDETHEIALYRIAQEAVNNALRHASAQNIDVRLTRDTDGIVLEIIDDGCGFNPAGCIGAGLGLSTMRDRAKTAGSELTIESEPGRTCVKTRILLADPAE